ncbi:hypothetical protein GCM10027053_14860 [Intrasporangium mesophilum]
MRAWWGRLRTRQRLGGLLAVIGGGLTVLLAFLGNETEPPGASTQALIAFLAILAQLASAWAFSGDGKADPGLAQRSVGRLVGLAQRAEAARTAIETLQSANNVKAEQLRLALGQLSVHLSYIEEGYLDAVEDWRIFHPEAVQKAERSSDLDAE